MRNGLIALAALSLGLSMAAAAAPSNRQPAAPAAKPEQVSVHKDLYACRTIADVAERAACYDKAVDALQTAESSGKVVVVDAVKVQQLKREAFGFDLPSLPALSAVIPSISLSTLVGERAGAAEPNEPEVREASLDIETVETDVRGNRVFRMANGQVWRELNASGAWVPKQGPMKAEIKMAAMGSFLLRVNGKGVAFRVQRER
jgi:hypothetical protein